MERTVLYAILYDINRLSDSWINKDRIYYGDDFKEERTIPFLEQRCNNENPSSLTFELLLVQIQQWIESYFVEEKETILVGSSDDWD